MLLNIYVGLLGKYAGIFTHAYVNIYIFTYACLHINICIFTYAPVLILMG